MRSDNPLVATIVSFSLSATINGAAIITLDRAMTWQETHSLQQVRSLEQKNENLKFEFIETPSKSHPHKPLKRKKIAARDSLNQDLEKNKTIESQTPKIDKIGPTDQLAQRQVLQGTQKQEAQEEKNKQEKKAENKPMKPSANPGKIMNQQTPQPKEAEKPSKKVQSQSESLGLSGSDKITTQEVTKSKAKGAAKFYGITSFEATGSGMGEYMKKLKEKVWLTWFPNIAFKFPQDFRGADAIIEFILNKQGDVKAVRALEDNKNPIFASYCAEAIQRAGNFGSLPDEILALLGKDELEIRFAFHYH